MNLSILDIMINNESCKLIHLQDVLETNNEEEKRIDYTDAELEHLIRDPSNFIKSLKRFMHKKKLEDSFSL